MSQAINLKRPYTSDEFEQIEMDNDENRYELIEGKIIVVPPAGGQHGRIAQRLNKYLLAHDPEGTFGEIWQATRFKIAPGFSPAPDLAFLKAYNIPEITREAIDAVPDLAVEVWSPGDTDTKAHLETARRKARLYQAAGVALTWCINPKNQTVEIYRAEITGFITLNNLSELDGEDVIPGFKLPVSKLFE